MEELDVTKNDDENRKTADTVMLSEIPIVPKSDDCDQHIKTEQNVHYTPSYKRLDLCYPFLVRNHAKHVDLRVWVRQLINLCHLF